MTAPLADLFLEVLVCAFDPATRTIDTTRCFLVCEVVANVPECAERLDEIKLRLPSTLTLASFPECWRPRRPCAGRR